MKNTVAEYNGKKVYLNEKLIKQRKLTKEQIENIKNLHVQKLKVISEMELTNDIDKLHHLAEEIENIEFQLQKNWGFEQNRNFHYWWLVPKCTCPDHDNIDRYGTPYRVISQDCPVHGQIKIEKDNLFKRLLKIIKIKW